MFGGVPTKLVSDHTRVIGKLWYHFSHEISGARSIIGWLALHGNGPYLNQATKQTIYGTILLKIFPTSYHPDIPSYILFNLVTHGVLYK